MRVASLILVVMLTVVGCNCDASKQSIRVKNEDGSYSYKCVEGK